MSRFSTRSCFTAVACGALAIFSAGCGEKRATVSGAVTLKGQPVTSGLVKFWQGAVQVGSGTIGADGKYLADNLPVDDLRVTVEQIKSGGLPGGKMKGGPGMPGVPGMPSVPGMPGVPGAPGGKGGKVTKAPDNAPPTADIGVVVPDKYSAVESSGLSVKVEGKSQVFDIPLQ